MYTDVKIITMDTVVATALVEEGRVYEPTTKRQDLTALKRRLEVKKVLTIIILIAVLVSLLSTLGVVELKEKDCKTIESVLTNLGASKEGNWTS